MFLLVRKTHQCVTTHRPLELICFPGQLTFDHRRRCPLDLGQAFGSLFWGGVHVLAPHWRPPQFGRFPQSHFFCACWSRLSLLGWGSPCVRESQKPAIEVPSGPIGQALSLITFSLPPDIYGGMCVPSMRAVFALQVDDISRFLIESGRPHILRWSSMRSIDI